MDVLDHPDVRGDGVHDDTAGLQAALDSGAAVVRLPQPHACYLISRTLVMRSGQTLLADRNAVIRLADHAHAHMLTNADHGTRSRGLTVKGGIWDGNNAHQTCEYHQNGSNWRVPYDPARYLGVLLQFNNVEDLHLSGLTLKDPEAFGIQVANLRRFTIEDLTFDYNMLKLNMDGVHVHGNCHQGRLANLKGATNDDQVALNADDGWMYEMSRGPITDIQIDGVWAENGYTAVRLLSAGSPIRGVRISNLFGSYRYFVTSFTHHNIHPGEPTTFEDIVIDGVFCAKPTEALDGSLLPDGAAVHRCPLFWVESQGCVRSVLVSNLVRTERLENAPPCFHIAEGARVEHLSVCQASVTNHAATPLDFLHNEGTIESLSLASIYCRAEGGAPRGTVVRNDGRIANQTRTDVVAHNPAATEGG
ncbi:MAG: hypothetical protein KKI08_10055 [Armatimonadetes bacterium]|nr:hypothetical protein [Armatimonadota bacterium]